MGKYSTPNTSSRSNSKAGAAKADNPDIGNSGNTNGAKSTEGGQLSFMPSCSEYLGTRYVEKEPGQSEGNEKISIPFLPSSASDTKDA